MRTPTEAPIGRSRGSLARSAAHAPSRSRSGVSRGACGSDGVGVAPERPLQPSNFWAMEIRIDPSQSFTDLRSAPSRELLLDRDDELLDLHRQLVCLPVGTSGAIGQAVEPGVPVAVEDLVAGLARDAELTAQRSHLLAVEETGHESQTFVHLAPLLPGHGLLPSHCGGKVLPMSPEWSATHLSGSTPFGLADSQSQFPIRMNGAQKNGCEKRSSISPSRKRACVACSASAFVQPSDRSV